MLNTINKSDSLWLTIGKDSFDFEHSMDSLHRKQTGSYYTDLELTLAMMQEMVASLDEDTRDHIYLKKFLEPCVGTGNFVFAYLKVCKDLGFTKEQYSQLLNNIYVCDINKQALEVYKKNLIAIANAYFGIELEMEYFDTHLGSGLMIDVDSEETNYISIEDVFGNAVTDGGFYFVVTNPPYKNLKAEKAHYNTDQQYERDKEKYTAIGKMAEKLFPFSATGTLNLYKLFVEEISERYVSPDGVCSLLIPASILSDKTCSKLRTRLLHSSSILSIKIISEDSSFVDASQALCALLFHKGGKSSTILVDGSFAGNESKAIAVDTSDIIDESTGNAILVLSRDEYAIRKKMREHPTIKDLNFIDNLRGELDLTLNKNSITDTPTDFKLYRGRHIGYYCINEQDDTEYVTENFVNSTAKKKYILCERIICQQIANMAKKRRLSFTIVPANSVLGNSCNFISLQENNYGIDIYYLLGLLNSSLMDWYFKLTSSNNHINNYEIDSFPIPVNYEQKDQISELVKSYISTKDEATLNRIESLVYEAYGIIYPHDVEGEKKENKVDNDSIFSNKDTVLKRFTNDLHELIPTISDVDCLSIITGENTIINFVEGETLSKFDKSVLLGIERKYRQLYNGEILNHTTFKLSDLDLEMIKPVPQGGSWKDIPQETVQKSKRLARISQTGGRTTLYGRIDYSKPSYTITTYFNRPGNGTYVHPVHERVISVREAARFQCFPDEYLFCGNKTDMLKQVGNAVPVMLAYNLGKAIKEKTGCSTSVDLFSGAGGMTYGFKLAGIKAAIANDIVENACITLKVNSPEIPVLCGDITAEETKKNLIDAGTASGADIICGGPPCQGFSMAGFRMKDDPRNQLFRHFVDIVSRVNPKVIVFENVEGILSYQGGETYRNIIELFSELGYNTEGRKLMANHYGAPQRRKRVIILCTRKDLDVLPSDIFPEPVTPNADRQISAYETIYDLEKVECGENARYCSNYSSEILRFLKGEIGPDEYLDAVRDERGVLDLTEPDCDDSETEEEMGESKGKATKPKRKGKSKKDDGYKQLTLFDMFD